MAPVSAFAEASSAKGFSRVVSSVSRILQFPTSLAAQNLLEFVIEGSLACELQASKGRVYLVAILSEEEEIGLGDRLLMQLLEEMRPGQFPGCVFAYEEDRQRVIVWQEINAGPGISDSELDQTLRRAIQTLELCFRQSARLFSSNG